LCKSVLFHYYFVKGLNHSAIKTFVCPQEDKIIGLLNFSITDYTMKMDKLLQSSNLIVAVEICFLVFLVEDKSR